jgi:hypothetical protein
MKMKLDQIEYQGHVADGCLVRDHIEMEIRPVAGGFTLTLCYDAWDRSPLIPLWKLRQIIQSKAKAEEVMEAVLFKGEINLSLWDQL